MPVVTEMQDLPGGKYGPRINSAVNAISEKTAAYTVLGSDNGTLFTNRGASGSVTFTLPAPVAGLFFSFQKAVNNQNIVVTTDVAGTKIHGLTQGVTLTNSTSEYGSLSIWCDGTAWFTRSSQGTWAVS